MKKPTPKSVSKLPVALQQVSIRELRKVVGCGVPGIPTKQAKVIQPDPVIILD